MCGSYVAYDSHADGGKDILDNEVIDWFEKLRQYTPNATFILDSCHSGSEIKDIGSLVPPRIMVRPPRAAARDKKRRWGVAKR